MKLLLPRLWECQLILQEETKFISANGANALYHFLDVLKRWKGVKRLLGPLEDKQIWKRHILNSLQLLMLVPTATRWLDVGTGNGFPAIAIASNLIEIPNAYVYCVETDVRKCAFIAAVGREVGLPLFVTPRRIEDILPGSIQQLEVITARAFKNLNGLVAVALPYLITGAVGIFPLGSKIVNGKIELITNNVCRAEWFVSSSDPESIIVRVSSSRRAPT